MEEIKAWGEQLLRLGVRKNHSVTEASCIQRMNIIILVCTVLIVVINTEYFVAFGGWGIGFFGLIPLTFGSIFFLNHKNYFSLSRPLLILIILFWTSFTAYHQTDYDVFIQELAIPFCLPVFLYPTYERKGLLIAYGLTAVVTASLLSIFGGEIGEFQVSRSVGITLGLIATSILLSLFYFRRLENLYHEKQALGHSLIQKEKQAQNIDEKLSALFNHSTDAILFLDIHTFCVENCNPRAVQLFEVEKAEHLFGKSAFDLSWEKVPKQQVAEALLAYQKLKDIHGEWQYSTQNNNPDDRKMFWGRFHASIFDDRQIQFAILRITDITAIKQASIDLEASQERYRTIFEYAGDALLLLDYGTFNVTDANRKAVKMFGGKSQVDLLGLGIDHFFLRKEDSEVIASILGFILYTGHWEANKRCVTLNGKTVFWAEVNISRVKFGNDYFWLARFADIETRKLQEEKLIAQKMKLKAIFNNSVDALFILDPENLKIVECNRQASQDWNLSRLKIKGLSPNMLLAKPFLPFEWEEIINTVEQKGRWEAQLLNVDAAGEPFWGAWAVIKTGVGDAQFYLLRIKNIDELKKNERLILEQQQKLLHNIEQLRDTQSFGQIATWQYDALQNRYSYSDELFRLLEISDKHRDVSFSIFKAMMSETEYTSFRQELRLKMEAQRDFHIIWSVNLPSGRRKTLHNRSRIELDPITGKTLKVSGVVMDISELKRYEVNLEHTNARFRAVFENAPIAIWAFSPEGRILFHNSATAYFFGYENSEMRHIPIEKLVHEDDFDFYQMKLYHLDEGQETSVQFELRFNHREGMVLWGQVSVTVLPTHEPSKKYKVIMVADISLQKTREAELEQARQVAETANKAKAEFLAHLSHDLRNPLNGIFGSARMMENVLTDENQLHYLHLIRISAKKLGNSIANILDFSKLEARKLEINPHPFNLKNLLDETAVLYANLSLEKDLHFEYLLPDFFYPYLIGDSHVVSRILDNLLSNAIKFTHEGEISLIVNQDCIQEDDTVWTHFIVQDTGIGIRPEDRDQLFQPFRQLDASTTKQYQGTGLGLVIARSFARQMGGDIIYNGNDGISTSFVCSVPFKKATIIEIFPSSGGDTLPDQSHGQELFDWMKYHDKTPITKVPTDFRILIGEDDEVNAEYLFSLMRRWGYQADPAYNGKQVLKRIQSKEYDLILLDGAMPIMDGYETIIAIRELEKGQGNKNHIPIIGVTGYALAGDREKFLEAGADDYTTKPINEEHLHALIEKHLKIV